MISGFKIPPRLLKKTYSCNHLWYFLLNLQILLDAKEYFKKQSSLVHITVSENEKFTVCGDIHGQYYDLYNIFQLNGLPSPENPYVSFVVVNLLILGPKKSLIKIQSPKFGAPRRVSPHMTVGPAKEEISAYDSLVRHGGKFRRFLPRCLSIACGGSQHY